MATEHHVVTTPPSSPTTTHPRDVHNVLESLPTLEKEPSHTQALLDAIAKHQDDAVLEKESPMFRAVLTGMIWVGGAFIGAALAVTLSSILK